MVKDYLMVVDDHAGVRQLLCAFLTQEGFYVKEAPDGLTALQLVRKDKPKLVFLDLRMPGLSGMETLKKLKELSPQTLIVVMTAYTRDKDIMAAVQNGHIKHYVYKPFDLDNLRNILHNLLDNHNVGEQSI